MVKLRRLKIERYRNVEPCELTFGDGLNIVLGPNGGGKTTLLNLVSRVLHGNLTNASDPFAVEIDLVFPGGSLSGRLATREAPPLPGRIQALQEAAGMPPSDSGDGAPVDGIEVDLSILLDANETRITIQSRAESLEFGFKSATGVGSFSLARGILEMPYSALFYLLIISRQLAGDTSAVALMPQMLTSALTLRFDEGLDMYRALVAKAEDAVPQGQDVRPSWVLLESDGQDVPSPPLYRGGLLASSIQGAGIAAPHGLEEVQVALAAAQLGFLSDVVRLFNFKSAEARFELIEKIPVKNGQQGRFANLKFWFTRRDGSILQDHQLSYGQKRLLTFLYYVDASPSFVIADELVNGMHHQWIEECFRAIGDRQSFLTSQNPLLLDYLTFESVEQVKSSFIVCRTELREGRERMIWRNFTDDEADMFFSAYRVGIEHVGEILRTRGLW